MTSAQLIAFFIGFIVMVVETLLIVSIDTKRRAANPIKAESEFGDLRMYEPERSTVVMLSILCNLAALPYYFYKTRNSAAGFFIGVGGFLAVFVSMVLVQTVVMMALRIGGVQ
jgi:hypothetical protein